MILSLITYPLSPKIKPILTVYANVSELPPPLTLTPKFFLLKAKIKVCRFDSPSPPSFISYRHLDTWQKNQQTYLTKHL